MKKFVKVIGLLTLSSCILVGGSTAVFAEEASSNGKGHIQFTGDKGDGLVKDPEHPENPVDPGDSPKTDGDLRIEFVPQLNFNANQITTKDMVYSANAQLFHDSTPARGNFIQITDSRGGGMGWTLQLRQEMQFQNSTTANSQLDGAVLSFDKSWVNSTVSKEYAPAVSKEVIRLDNIGATYNLAEAKVGTGGGTWSISFGASGDNPAGLNNTLTPKTSKEGEKVLDPVYENKQVYENSAVTLSIPGATKKDPVTYTAVLTWILAELP